MKKRYKNEEEEEENIDLNKMIRRSLINESSVRAFIDEFQPETDERKSYVIAMSMGEIREHMNIYRTFDDKMPDPLPFYLERLEEDGFHVRMGFARELVILVSRRNNGKGTIIE